MYVRVLCLCEGLLASVCINVFVGVCPYTISYFFNVTTLVALENLDTYEPHGLYCLKPDYKPKQDPNYFTYVDVTLLGCKYLCQTLHDLPCSQIIYMPFRQTCVLQPDVPVPVVPYQENCTKIELYRRRRTIGMSNSVFSGVMCQKQASRAATSNHIPQILWGVITSPWAWSRPHGVIHCRRVGQFSKCKRYQCHQVWNLCIRSLSGRRPLTVKSV